LAAFGLSCAAYGSRPFPVFILCTIVLGAMGRAAQALNDPAVTQRKDIFLYFSIAKSK
jgi:hypothetical protein